MPDALTPEERAAIAAYVGPVQIIPRGVSGLPPETYGAGTDFKLQNRKHWAEAAARGRAKAAYLRRLENNHNEGA